GEKLPAVHIRHHEVEKDESRQDALLSQVIESETRVAEAYDAMPLLLQDLGQTLAHVIVVFDDQDVVLLFPVHFVSTPDAAQDNISSLPARLGTHPSGHRVGCEAKPSPIRYFSERVVADK